MSAATPTAAMITARLDRLPASREIWKLVILLSLGGGFELYDLLMTGYVAPGLVRSGIFSAGHTGLFGLPDQAAFASVTFAGLFVGTIGFGYVADKFGRRNVFTWALLWYSIMTVIMACQNSVVWVDIWRFIAGIGIGVELVTIDTYIAELVPKEMRGRAFTSSRGSLPSPRCWCSSSSASCRKVRAGLCNTGGWKRPSASPPRSKRGSRPRKARCRQPFP
jgi:putative MFS transporter